MKFKIIKTIGGLIAGLSLLTFGSISNVKASCENAPLSGSRFRMTGPDTFKLRHTFQTFIDTKNARKLNFLLQEADRQAQSELAEFFKGVFNGSIDIESGGKSDFLVGNDDMSEEDILAGFTNAKKKFNTEVKSFDARGSIKVGQCVEPGQQIVVTREITSEQIFAASNLKNGIQEKTKNETKNVINEDIESNVRKSTVQRGYDGYGNLEDF